MAFVEFNDRAWEKVKGFLTTEKRIYIGDETECHKFLGAVSWISRSGAPWRMLPKEYGDWNSVYKRFARWESHGVLERIMNHFSQDRDFRNMMLDSTIVRAHPCAAGALKKTVGRKNRR
jgi:transposase